MGYIPSGTACICEVLNSTLITAKTFVNKNALNRKLCLFFHYCESYYILTRIFLFFYFFGGRGRGFCSLEHIDYIYTTR